MARMASPTGKGSIVFALLLALAFGSLSFAPSLADSPANSDANTPAGPAAPTVVTITAGPAASERVAPAPEPSKPTPAERGDAQSFLDARDGYTEAQNLFH